MKDVVRRFYQQILHRYVGSLKKNTIEYWQYFIFYILAIAGSLLGTASLIIGLIVLFSKGELLACLFLVFIYAINIFFIVSRLFSIRIKNLVIAFNFYLFGVASLVIAGPIGESGIWFSVTVLLCSLFIGFKTALAFAVLNFLTGLVFGLLHTQGLADWQYITFFPLRSWLLQSGNIFLVDMMFAIANTALIRGIGNTFRSLNEAEGQIQASLAEKETLIRELYHRTKNNMQVVSSLLTLHSNGLDSPIAKGVFKDVINKIVAMSLVHQKLYESQDLSNIDLADYIRDLVALLMRSYGASSDRVKVDMRLEHTKMLIDTAVPCGLVFSEIIANALKYAFPKDRKGHIGIELKKVENDMIAIRIQDDGIGLPEGFQVATHGRMGMRTLFTMVQHQLHGFIEYVSDGGLRYNIKFKGNMYDERVHGS